MAVGLNGGGDALQVSEVVVAQLVLNETHREAVMAGGDRGVGGKNGTVSHNPAGIVAVNLLVVELVELLDHEQGRVTLVEVVDGGLVTERGEGLHPADPEYDFL